MNKFILKKLKSRIPALLLIASCFIVIAVTADFSQFAVMTSSTLVSEKKTIVLDAGHGGLDSGAVGIGGELEKDINLSIVYILRDMLSFSGFNVVLTRDGDMSMHDDGIEGIRNQKVSDMKNRLEVIKKNGDCIFISIHQNKFTTPDVHGAQVFYNDNNPSNKVLAQYVQDNFRKIDEGNDRTIKTSGDELYLFRNTNVPAILVECGFLSNPDEAKKLSDSEYQKKVAFTVYSGIFKYLQTV